MRTNRSNRHALSAHHHHQSSLAARPLAKWYSCFIYGHIVIRTQCNRNAKQMKNDRHSDETMWRSSIPSLWTNTLESLCVSVSRHNCANTVNAVRRSLFVWQTIQRWLWMPYLRGIEIGDSRQRTLIKAFSIVVVAFTCDTVSESPSCNAVESESNEDEFVVFFSFSHLPEHHVIVTQHVMWPLYTSVKTNHTWNW